MIEKINQKINEKLKDIISEVEKVIKGKNQIQETKANLNQKQSESTKSNMKNNFPLNF